MPNRISGTAADAAASAQPRATIRHLLALAAAMVVLGACGATTTVVAQGGTASPTATATSHGGTPTPTATTGGGGGGGILPTPTPTHPPAPSGPTVFVQHATPANSSDDYTTITSCACDGNANALLIVTPTWNPGGAGGVYDNHPIGVFYIGPHWAIFNQDHTAIPNGAAFDVWVLTAGSPFVQHATAGNSVSNYTVIGTCPCNGNPNATLLVTPNWNPGGGVGVYDDHPIGVFYLSSSGHWAIFNQDLNAIPNGAAFNVLDLDALYSHGGLLWTASPSNSAGDYTVVDKSGLNGNTAALLFVTPNWNPNGASGVYDNHNIGVFYSTSQNRWAIFNQDISAIPNGASFNFWQLGAA